MQFKMGTGAVLKNQRVWLSFNLELVLFKRGISAFLKCSFHGKLVQFEKGIWCSLKTGSGAV